MAKSKGLSEDCAPGADRALERLATKDEPAGLKYRTKTCACREDSSLGLE